MISGKVNTSNEAVIRLLVRGPEGFEREIEVIIDTGFSGSLSLPSTIITALELPFRRIGRAILADGKESLFNIFEATVDWNGKPRRVGIHAAETDPLIGMNLLYGYELTIHVVENGNVVIEKLS